MDANLLTSIAGILLSVGFAYIPKLDTWFAVLSDTTKRLVMAGLLLLVAVVSFGIACADLPWVGVTCDKDGIIGLVEAFVWALVANQSAYPILPKTKRTLVAKSMAKNKEGLG